MTVFNPEQVAAEISGSVPLQPHDSDLDSSNDSDIDSICSITVQEHDLFRIDDDVDLASQVLKNVFITADPSAAAKAPQCDPAPEQSFKCNSDAIDWEF
jgi:hypothetical protein